MLASASRIEQPSPEELPAPQSRANAFSHSSPGLAEVSGSKLEGIGAQTVVVAEGDPGEAITLESVKNGYPGGKNV